MNTQKAWSGKSRKSIMERLLWGPYLPTCINGARTKGQIGRTVKEMEDFNQAYGENGLKMVMGKKKTRRNTNRSFVR